ncbi:glycerate kinase, partial [bacterium]|nr:glycerate kinase [bacterium]
MRIVVAPNAFKESLSAMRAARALERGLRRALPDAEIVAVPMADGGDGTVETLLAVRGGEMREVRVCDPLGRLVTASYAALGDGGTAVIEIASASGLRLLCPDERDPMRTSTRGTGELIRHAFEHGARRLTVGVGGSATVDGGVGVAAALGWRFLDARGHEVEPCGGCLEEIVALDDSNYRRWVKDRGEGIEIDVACDVANPLLGCDGAARVYGPQKGATPGQVERLEAGLRNLSDVIRGETG